MKILKSELDKLLELSPGGKPNEISFILNQILGQATFDGTIITFQFIYDSYLQYKLWWNKTYKGKFFKDDKRLRNLLEYINEKLYEETFDISGRTDSRSEYLFGNYDEIKDAHKNYITKFYGD